MNSSKKYLANANKIMLDKIKNYFEANPQLRVLFFFENEIASWADILKDLTWPEGYEYVDFDGNWFKAKYMLEHDWKDKHVVLHFNHPTPRTNDDRLAFPLLDTLCANMEFCNDTADMFIQKYRIDAEHRPFIVNHRDTLQSQKAEQALSAHYQSGGFDEELIIRTLFCIEMGADNTLSMEEIWVRLIALSTDNKKFGTFINKYTRLTPHARGLREWFDKQSSSLFGKKMDMNKEYPLKEIIEVMKYNYVTQTLNPVPEDPYIGLKINDSIKQDSINAIMHTGKIASATIKAKFAAAINEQGTNIHEKKIVEVYGADADYKVFTKELSWNIMAYHLGKVKHEPNESKEKIEEIAERCDSNSEIGTTADFLMRVCCIVAAFKEAKNNLTFNTPTEYLDQYISSWYRTDQHYRKMVGYFYKLDNTVNPLFTKLHDLKKQIDKSYSNYLFKMNDEWMNCLKDSGYDLKSLTGKKHANFFKDQVKDFPYKIAIIVSDGLRYEVAQEVVNIMNNNKRNLAVLDYQIGILPTETKYAKPLLLPYETVERTDNGCLLDGDNVSDNNYRTRHLQKFKEKSLCENFQKLLSNTEEQNREIFKNDIVYIFHDSIDGQCHNAQTAKQICMNIDEAAKELAAKVRSIQTTLNVTKVILTADHGFLFNDTEIADADKQKIDDTDIKESTPRYYLTSNANEKELVYKIPLSKVSPFNDNIMIAMPHSTNRFNAYGNSMYTHGGSSLQELIVPVVICSSSRTDAKTPVSFELQNCGNIHYVNNRIKFTLLQTEVVSTTKTIRSLVCRVYEDGDTLVKEQDVILNFNEPRAEDRKKDVSIAFHTTKSVLKLKIFDEKDLYNALYEENVTNKNLIDCDFDF